MSSIKKVAIVNHKKLNRIPEKVFVVMHLSDWWSELPIGAVDLLKVLFPEYSYVLPHLHHYR